MPLKTPEFWYQRSLPHNLMAICLTPISWMYNCAQYMHRAFSNPKSVSVPVICIGNINAGGGGKTPTVQAIVRLIRDEGLSANPFILSRGYGADNKTPVLVNADQHTVQDVGDEPLLHTRIAPTVVCHDRFLAAEYAIQNGATCLVMDDGFYNYDIVHDLDIITVDANMGFGNERVLPAGPLREDKRAGLRRADAVIKIGGKELTIDHLSVYSARIIADEISKKKKRYVAFCGIARPKKFFDFLRNDMHVEIEKTYEFPDHHVYTKAEWGMLSAHNTPLITTEKDSVRLSADQNKVVHMLPIRLVFDDAAAMRRLLRGVF